MLQLQRRNHLTGIHQKQPQRRQFLRRQVDDRRAAPERPISFQPKSSKGPRRLSTLKMESRRFRLPKRIANQ
jgi:hypothetical protein